MPARILVVDDERPLVESIRYSLEREGFTCTAAFRGDEGLDLAIRERPDLIILDLMLPGLDGLEVCRRIRRSSDVPIIMLTAKESEADRVAGLELGADDYVIKPFSMRELVARIRSVLRRSSAVPPTPEVTTIGDIRLDRASRDVHVKSRRVELTAKEFDLLAFLMQNNGRVLTREVLLDRVWGSDFFGEPRTVDVHIRWLREKIEPDPAVPRFIQTVRGVGYKFAPEGTQESGLRP